MELAELQLALRLAAGTSGKIQMEVPLLISSHPERIICRPCLMSERSRNRQWMSSIQFFNSGMRESSFFGDKSAGTRNRCIGYKDIEIAAVIADV